MPEDFVTDFCIKCRKEVQCLLRKRTVTAKVKDKEYMFEVAAFICPECGEAWGIPHTFDNTLDEIHNDIKLQSRGEKNERI